LACGGFPELLALRDGCLAGDALLQRLHEVHHVLAPRSRFNGNGLAAALRIDEVHQSFFVVPTSILPASSLGTVGSLGGNLPELKKYQTILNRIVHVMQSGPGESF
jgi:hypothetical protein